VKTFKNIKNKEKLKVIKNPFAQTLSIGKVCWCSGRIPLDTRTK